MHSCCSKYRKPQAARSLQSITLLLLSPSSLYSLPVLYKLNYTSYLLIKSYIAYLSNYRGSIFTYSRQKLPQIDRLKLAILYINLYRRQVRQQLIKVLLFYLLVQQIQPLLIPFSSIYLAPYNQSIYIFFSNIIFTLVNILLIYLSYILYNIFFTIYSPLIRCKLYYSQYQQK